MVDQALAHQAAYRAKQETITHETWAELLHKPSKWTKEVMKTKAKELLDALNPINWLKNIQKLKKNNLELETDLYVLHKNLEFAKGQIESNKEFLKKGTKFTQFYDEALKTLENLLETNKKLREDIKKTDQLLKGTDQLLKGTDQLLKETVPLRKVLRGD